MEGGCRAICVSWAMDLGVALPAFLPSAWGNRQLICPPEGLHTMERQVEGCPGELPKVRGALGVGSASLA